MDTNRSFHKEPGALLSHEEFYREQNKLDGQASGLSDNFVNNRNHNGEELSEDVFDSDNAHISYPGNNGAVQGSEKIYNSIDDFNDEYGNPEITRRGEHDGTYFSIGEASYEDLSLAQKDEYFNEKTVDYKIESLPDNCKIVTGDVAEWAGHEGGGKQVQFAKTDKDGEIIRDDNGNIEAYSVSDLEYDKHINRINQNDNISEEKVMADNNTRESINDKLNSMGHKHTDAETKRNPNPESTRAALHEMKNEQTNTEDQGK